jgi:hypothetical protein
MNQLLAPNGQVLCTEKSVRRCLSSSTSANNDKLALET